MSASEVRVSQSALRANFTAFARLAGSAHRVLAVVKADAYGHGMRGVVQSLTPLRPAGFGVAHASEALALRAYYAGRIVVLSAWQSADLATAIRTKVELVVWDRESAAVVNRTAQRLGRKAHVHAKVDTGTGRIGVAPEQTPEFIRAILRLRSLTLTGAFTHFSDAEDETDGFTARQLGRFIAATQSLPPQVGRHAACSAAVLRFPASTLDFVRVGIGLYGLWPSARSRRAAPRVRLTPALRWETQVLQVKRVPKGSTVGYGRTFRTRRRSLLAILPVGYADGYPRALSNRGVVLLRGARCPVVGRVSMNLTVVDATGVRSVRPGDAAVLIGEQGEVAVTADELARSVRTVHYELTTRIAASVPRIRTA